MDMLDAGMALAPGQNLNDGQPLGRQLVAIVPQFPDDGVESIFRVGQLKPHLSNNNYYQLTSISFYVNGYFRSSRQGRSMMLPSPANGAQIVECPHRVDICLSNGEAEGTSDELAYSIRRIACAERRK
jgi:hypothetical protein